MDRELEKMETGDRSWPPGLDYYWNISHAFDGGTIEIGIDTQSAYLGANILDGFFGN